MIHTDGSPTVCSPLMDAYINNKPLILTEIVVGNPDPSFNQLLGHTFGQKVAMEEEKDRLDMLAKARLYQALDIEEECDLAYDKGYEDGYRGGNDDGYYDALRDAEFYFDFDPAPPVSFALDNPEDEDDAITYFDWEAFEEVENDAISLWTQLEDYYDGITEVKDDASSWEFNTPLMTATYERIYMSDPWAEHDWLYELDKPRELMWDTEPDIETPFFLV